MQPTNVRERETERMQNIIFDYFNKIHELLYILRIEQMKLEEYTQHESM